MKIFYLHPDFQIENFEDVFDHKETMIYTLSEFIEAFNNDLISDLGFIGVKESTEFKGKLYQLRDIDGEEEALVFSSEILDEKQLQHEWAIYYTNPRYIEVDYFIEYYNKMFNKHIERVFVENINI